MARIAPYFGPHTGPLKIWLGIFQIGSGNFTAFSDFQADFSGTYSALGHSGRFAIKIALTDQNAASTSGACHIVLNGRTDNTATYEADGAKLTVKTVLERHAARRLCQPERHPGRQYLGSQYLDRVRRRAPRGNAWPMPPPPSPRRGEGKFSPRDNPQASPAPNSLPAPAARCYAKPVPPESHDRAREDA